MKKWNPYKKHGVLSDKPGDPIELDFDYEIASADWKDIERLVDEIKEACAKYGVYIYNHPLYEGSDLYGLVITNQALTKEQLESLARSEREETPDGE